MYPTSIPNGSTIVLQADVNLRHGSSPLKYHNFQTILPLLLLFEKFNSIPIVIIGLLDWKNYIKEYNFPPKSAKVSYLQLPIEDFSAFHTDRQEINYCIKEFREYIKKCELASFLNHEISSHPKSFEDKFTLSQYQQLIHKISLL